MGGCATPGYCLVNDLEGSGPMEGCPAGGQRVVCRDAGDQHSWNPRNTVSLRFQQKKRSSSKVIATRVGSLWITIVLRLAFKMLFKRF